MMDEAFSQTFEFLDGIIRVNASCFAFVIALLHFTPLTLVHPLLSHFINLPYQITVIIIHP